MNTFPSQPDVYVACHGKLVTWGGGVIVGHSTARACAADGMSAVLLGFGNRDSEHETLGGVPQWHARLDQTPLLWRVHGWLTGVRLARQLRRLPPPRVGFVSLSPFWTVASKRVWPDVPVTVRFCGLVSSCAEIISPGGGKRPFWDRVSQAGVTWTERRAMRVADRILVPTPEHVEELAEFEPSTRARTIVCPEGTREIDFSPEGRRRIRAELGLRPVTYLLAAIGTCDRNKAFDHAIRELTRTREDVHLVIIGDGPEHGRLGELVGELGLSDRVTLAGRQTDMAAWLSAADCVASTSIYDTFPNVVREAMCCGRPVLVPKHDPPRVRAGVTGIIAREGGGLVYDRLEEGALASVIDELASDRLRSDRLGAAALRVAERVFDWSATARQIRIAAGRAADAPIPSGGDRVAT